MFMECDIDQNYHPQIIVDLQPVRLPQLKLISLRYNSLLSIEGLHRLYMPRLETLKLSKSTFITDSNLIVCFEDLNKVRWENLKLL